MFGNLLSSFHIWNFILTVCGILILPWLYHQALHFWYHYKGEYFIAGITWTLLEIEVPRENEKTPLSMELILTNALHQPTNKSPWAKYKQGQVTLWSVLEMVSIEGRIRFFIRCPSRMAGLVETQIYAQYPQAKVKEAEDYVFMVGDVKKGGEWSVGGGEFTLEKSDPYPIRTYVDYGLDKPGTKEEHKIDPLTATIELFGTMKKDEHMWMQIFVRASEKEYGHGHHGHRFKEECDEEIKKLVEPYAAKKTETGTTPQAPIPDFIKEKIEAIHKKSQKLAFDCGIRVVYAGKNGAYSNESRRALRTVFRQYSNPSTNSLIGTNGLGFDYPWQDPSGNKAIFLKKQHIDRYRTRTFFNSPFYTHWGIPNFLKPYVGWGFKGPKMSVLNTEELATIYHFPGMVSETPSFRRIESKIAKPPSNLPV